MQQEANIKLAQPPERQLNVRQLTLLAFAMLVAMLTLTLPVAQLEEFVGRLLPRGGEGMETANTAKGLFVSAHFAAYIPFAFLWGALSDRNGKRKPILLFGLAGQAAMFFVIPLVENIWLLYLARFIEGSFSIAVVSMLMTMAVDLAPAKKRGMTLGFFTLGMLLGNAAGAPLGGVLAGINYAYPFWTGAGLLVLVAAIAILFIRETGAVAPGYSFRRALLVLREHPKLAVPYGFTMLDRFTVGFYVSQFGVLVAQVYGVDARQRGVYLAVFLLCFALLAPLGGYISDRLGRIPSIVLGTVIYGLMLMLVGRVSAEMLYVVMAVGGVSGAILYPPSIALVGDYAGPGQRGAAMGGFNLAGSIGYAVGPVTFGIVADTFGRLAPPLVAGALCLVVAAASVPLMLRQRREEQVGGEMAVEA